MEGEHTKETGNQITLVEDRETSMELIIAGEEAITHLRISLQLWESRIARLSEERPELILAISTLAARGAPIQEARETLQDIEKLLVLGRKYRSAYVELIDLHQAQKSQMLEMTEMQQNSQSGLEAKLLEISQT